MNTLKLKLNDYFQNFGKYVLLEKKNRPLFNLLKTLRFEGREEINGKISLSLIDKNTIAAEATLEKLSCTRPSGASRYFVIQNLHATNNNVVYLTSLITTICCYTKYKGSNACAADVTHMSEETINFLHKFGFTKEPNRERYCANLPNTIGFFLRSGAYEIIYSKGYRVIMDESALGVLASEAQDASSAIIQTTDDLTENPTEEETASLLQMLRDAKGGKKRRTKKNKRNKKNKRKQRKTRKAY